MTSRSERITSPIAHPVAATDDVYVTSRRTSLMPLTAMVTAGIIGGIAGALLAQLALRSASGPDLIMAGAPLFVTAAAMAAGILVAWLLTSLALSWAPGRFRCPRCGTANERRARYCGACQLPFL